jgi:hypothetical protein
MTQFDLMEDRLLSIAVAIIAGLLLIGARLTGTVTLGLFSWNRSDAPVGFWFSVAVLGFWLVAAGYRSLVG